MLLPDFEIRRLCQQHGLVNPYIEENLNPASIDVRLGDRILMEHEHDPSLDLVSIREATPENPFQIHPGEWFLAEIMELIALPSNIGAQFVLKSSRAREGWDHAEAGWADPGYCGRLTLELKNARQHHPLGIWPGLKIGQLKFLATFAPVERSYQKTGRYQGDLVVTASKG